MKGFPWPTGVISSSTKASSLSVTRLCGHRDVCDVQIVPGLDRTTLQLRINQMWREQPLREPSRLQQPAHDLGYPAKCEKFVTRNVWQIIFRRARWQL